jgi:hypothetical protein
MGTKRRRNSKREEKGAANNGRSRTNKDVLGLDVIELIERERRNLRRASAVLASALEDDSVHLECITFMQGARRNLSCL